MLGSKTRKHLRSSSHNIPLGHHTDCGHAGLDQDVSPGEYCSSHTSSAIFLILYYHQQLSPWYSCIDIFPFCAVFLDLNQASALKATVRADGFTECKAIHQYKRYIDRWLQEYEMSRPWREDLSRRSTCQGNWMGLGQRDQIVWTTGMQACDIIDTKIKKNNDLWNQLERNTYFSLKKKKCSKTHKMN